MAEPMQYRDYLQYHANNHPSETKRREAQALLNVVGNDRNLDGNFLTGEKHGFLGMQTREQQSNGFTASAINSTLNPWWSKSYDTYLKQNETPGTSNMDTGPVDVGGYAGSYGGYTKPNYDAQNRAFYDRELNRFDDYFGQLDKSKNARINNINNNYNDSLNVTNQAWQRAQEDHDRAVGDRLRTRARQVSVADDDFKKQRDAYDRYFARIGAGSSSAAQHTVPALLAKAANKVRSDIEENNADNERTQTIAFNRARDDHERNIGNLGRDRDNQLRQAEMDWETKRGELFDKKAQLQTQRDLSAGKHYTEAINNANPLITQATQSANNAIAWGDVNPKFKVDQVEYKPELQKDWSYESTKTKVVDSGDENEDNAYDRYFRDREEEKKRKGWITPTNV